MPMSKASELQWCVFLRKVLSTWKNHDDIYRVSLQHKVPAKRIEKVVAWALRAQVIQKSDTKTHTRRHGYIVDHERAMLAIKRREARVKGEEEQGVDWSEFEVMWRGLIHAKQHRSLTPENACSTGESAMKTLSLLQEVVRDS